MDQAYSYLGIGDGFDHVKSRLELVPAITELKHDATALLQSGLAPWQVIKAIKTYLYPRVDYALRHSDHLTSSSKDLIAISNVAYVGYYTCPRTRPTNSYIRLSQRADLVCFR